MSSMTSRMTATTEETTAEEVEDEEAANHQRKPSTRWEGHLFSWKYKTLLQASIILLGKGSSIRDNLSCGGLLFFFYIKPPELLLIYWENRFLSMNSMRLDENVLNFA